MANPLEILWTARAKQDLDNIINYLQLKWTEREVKNFHAKLQKALSLIATRPKLFKATNQRKNLRRCVLSKQTTIYYQDKETVIYIVSLFDNRQDPSKKP